MDVLLKVGTCKKKKPKYINKNPILIEVPFF